MKTLLKYAVIAVMIALPSAGFAKCDDGEEVIKFSHVVNTAGHPKGIAAALLALRVNIEMQGKACMEVFANSSLYNDEKALEAMLRGDLQLAAPTLSKFEAYTKQFRIFDLPFMFQDIQAVDTFQQSPEGLAMLDGMRERGLQGLAYWHNGLKQMSANVPIIKPSDAEGLKFRVQPSDVLVAQMMAIGGTAQKTALAEVYGALQNGVVDAQENTWSNIYGQKFYEVQDGITETDHGVLDYLVVASVDWLDGLDPEIREQFLQILKEVTETRNTEATALNEQAKQAIIDSGGVVRKLSFAQRAVWVKAMRPVWVQFEDDVGAENINTVQKINCLQVYRGGLFCLSRQW